MEGPHKVSQQLDPKVSASLNNLIRFLSIHALESYDPYDFKALPKATWLTTSTLGARGLHSAGVTFPILTRKLLGIKPGVTASGVAYACSGFLRLFKAENNRDFLNRGEYYLEKLLSLRIERGGWGLPFAWQSGTTIRIPENTTLSYTTYTGLQALFDHYKLCGNENSLSLAVEIAYSALAELNWITHEDAGLVSYSKYDRYEVINTNALLGAILLKIAEASQEAKLHEIGITLLKFVVTQQDEDGSWSYFSKRTNKRSANDNYHSAMTLRGVLGALDVPGLNAPETIYRGTVSYCNKYLRHDVFPALWPEKKWPKDIACCAEGILYFNNLISRAPELVNVLKANASGIDVKNLALNLSRWAAREMQNADGSFLQRKYPFWGVDTKSLRWGQGMMLYALSTFLVLE